MTEDIIIEATIIEPELFILEDYDNTFHTPEKAGQLDLGFFEPWPCDPNEPLLLILWDGSRADQPDQQQSEKPKEEGTLVKKELPVYEITMENYSERMPMGIFKMEAGLMSGAGFTYDQMQKYREVAEVLNSYLTDVEKIKDLTPDQKMELSRLTDKKLEIGQDYLLELHNTFFKTQDNLNAVERMKAFTFKEPEILEDKSAKRELEALLLEQLKFVVKEKEKLAIINRR